MSKPDRHVTFQLPPGHELDESPLPSSSPLPGLFPSNGATTSAPRISPLMATSALVPRTSPTRNVPIKLPSPAEETSHLPVAAIKQSMSPQIGVVSSFPSTSLVPLPPVVTAPKASIPVSATHPHLNPLLRPGNLLYNVLEPPRHATSVGSLSSYQREQPATNPSIPNMHIVLSRGTSVRPIIVAQKSIVTVANVLDAAYEWLNGPIEDDAWMAMSFDERHALSDAYYKRNGGHDIHGRGVRRIDYFGDRILFNGLTPVPNLPGTWHLDLMSPTRRP